MSTETATGTEPADTASPPVNGEAEAKPACQESDAVASPEPGTTQEAVPEAKDKLAPTSVPAAAPEPPVEQETTPAPTPVVHAPENTPTPVPTAPEPSPAPEPAPAPSAAETSPPPAEVTAAPVTAPTQEPTAVTAPEPAAAPVSSPASEPSTAPVSAPAPEPTAAPVVSPDLAPEDKSMVVALPPSTADATPTPVSSPPKAEAATDSKVEKPSEGDNEPQNALTKKFTEREWSAVKELRKNLPAIFEKAYDKPEAKTTPITLWGVHVDPSKPQDAKVSVILVKFLRARNLSVRDAEKMLVATLRWRDEFKVEEAVKEEFPKEIFGQLGHVYGKDKEGRPVVYNLYGANKDLKSVFGDVQRFLRWRVALMEKSMTFLDFETVDQTVQIHDYEGVSLAQRDAKSKAAASEATTIFQNHYPECLSRKFFVNVPTLLTWIFWAFKPLISAATLAKMSVVGTGAHAIGRALLPVIDKAELPKRYGGEAAGF